MADGRERSVGGTDILYIPIAAPYVLQLVELLGEIDWSPEIMASDGLLASVLSLYPEQASHLEGMYATDLFTDTGEFVRQRRQTASV